MARTTTVQVRARARRRGTRRCGRVPRSLQRAHPRCLPARPSVLLPVGQRRRTRHPQRDTPAHRDLPVLARRARPGRLHRRPTAFDRLRVLPVRPHRRPHDLEPRPVRPPPPGPPINRPRHGPLRTRRLPLHRRTLRPTPRSTRRPARAQRPPSQRSVRHQHRGPRPRTRPPHPPDPRQGQQASHHPLVPRTARTIDPAIGERHEGPILQRRDGQRLDRRTAHRWAHAIGKKAGLCSVHPHMLRAAFIMAALDASVPLRDVQTAARHADPRTTTIYDRRRQNFDRHAAYVVVAFVAGG